MTGVAVVTGGSSGMGAACVRRYLAADLVFLLAGAERALYVTGETVVASGGLVFR